jgi:hypothetical protein
MDPRTRGFAGWQTRLRAGKAALRSSVTWYSPDSATSVLAILPEFAAGVRRRF